MCMVTVKEENEKETGNGWPREAPCRPRAARGCSGMHIAAHDGPFASSLQRQKKERATSFIAPRFQARAVLPPIAGRGEVPSPSVGDRPAGGARCITCQELLHHSRINSEANAMQGMLCNAAWCGVLRCNVVEATTRSPPLQYSRIGYNTLD